jgi:hypothetical protein
MIDPARALSVCHPIATIFITLLLASPALPPSPSSLSSAFSASSSSSPCCAFWQLETRFEFVDFRRIFVVGGVVQEEEEEEDQRRQQRTTTVSSSKLQQLCQKFQ